MNYKMPECLFCELQSSSRKLDENSLSYLVEDLYPVAQGHALVMPKRCVADFFDLTSEEIVAIADLLKSRREYLLSKDPIISGFNIGLNCGESAGQTIFHCHYHLIPRRNNDVVDPTGGVRAVIPGKANYRK